MSIWRAMRVRAAAGIVLAVGAAAVAGPAQAQPALQLLPRSAAVSWGDNQHGQLGNGSTTARATYAGVSGLSSGVAQVSAGFDSSMALTAGGTVWTWGDEVTLGTGSAAESTVPVQVPGLAGITQIAAGRAWQGHAKRREPPTQLDGSRRTPQDDTAAARWSRSKAAALGVVSWAKRPGVVDVALLPDGPM